MAACCCGESGEGGGKKERRDVERESNNRHGVRSGAVFDLDLTPAVKEMHCTGHSVSWRPSSLRAYIRLDYFSTTHALEGLSQTFYTSTANNSSRPHRPPLTSLQTLRGRFTSRGSLSPVICPGLTSHSTVVRPPSACQETINPPITHPASAHITRHSRSACNLTPCSNFQDNVKRVR